MIEMTFTVSDDAKFSMPYSKPCFRGSLKRLIQKTYPDIAIMTSSGSTGYLKRGVDQNGKTIKNEYATVMVIGQFFRHSHSAGDRRAPTSTGPQTNNIIQSLRVHLSS